MKLCPHEEDVKAMHRSGHWPEACPPSLRAHLDTCTRCAQHLLLVSAFQTSRTEALQEARLDHPNLLWWRAQLLRRNAALQTVSKPITAAQIFALVISLAAASFAVLQLSKAFNAPSLMTGPSAAPPPIETASFLASFQANPAALPVLAGIGSLALLSAIVIYLAASER